MPPARPRWSRSRAGSRERQPRREGPGRGSVGHPHSLSADLPCGHGQIPSHSSGARDVRRGGPGHRRCTAFGSPGGDFDAALLTGRDGRHWIVAGAPQRARRTGAVRRPRRPARPEHRCSRAAAVHRLDLRRAGARRRHPRRRLGVRLRLQGAPRVDEHRTRRIDRSPRSPPSTPCRPTSSSTPACPRTPPVETLRAVVGLMDRAAATGLVPAALLARWERASEESTLWQFTPVVINGALGSRLVPVAPTTRSPGLLGWHGLRVGDPASDLQWLAGAGLDDLADAAFAAYSRVRGTVDRQLRHPRRRCSPNSRSPAGCCTAPRPARPRSSTTPSGCCPPSSTSVQTTS